MIKLHRGATPAVLLSRGRGETATLCAQHDANPAAFASTKAEDLFNAKVYAAPEVKAALKRDQHGKCAFCEAKFAHVSYGDVEHYRPKAGSRQSRADPLLKPGYYWLAYTWDNLLLSCSLCNSRFKGNLFPLQEPAKRARAPQDDLGQEQPMFLNPYAADAGELDVEMQWHDEIVRGRAKDSKGDLTVRGLGLDRAELEENRREYLTPLRLLHEVVTMLSKRPDLSEVEKRWLANTVLDLHKRMEPDAEYTAMTRAWLARNPLPSPPAPG